MQETEIQELNLSQRWEIEHQKKILEELSEQGIELTIENIPPIVEATSFKVRSRKYPDKCPFYKKNPPEQCHPKVKDLNCFLCDCPEYLAHLPEGGCNIGNRAGKWAYHESLPAGKIWDCSDCTNSHSPKFVEKYLKKNLEKIIANPNRVIKNFEIS